MGDTGYFECELVAVIVKRHWIAWDGNVHLDGSWIWGLGWVGFSCFGVGKGIFGIYISVDKHCVVYGINKIDVEK